MSIILAPRIGTGTEFDPWRADVPVGVAYRRAWSQPPAADWCAIDVAAGADLTLPPPPADLLAWLAALPATPPPPYDPATQRCDWRAAEQRWEVWTTADYAALRAAAYPPIEELADAQAKQVSADPAVRAAGLAQQQLYGQRCLAVKARYPKPTPPATPASIA